MLDSVMNLVGSIVSSETLIAAVMFVVVLGILVFVHELGHYLAAKTVGVKVRSFSIGFGKELFGITRKNGERWRVSLFPLGGYVDLYGMDPEEEDLLKEKDKEVLSKAMCNKNVFSRMWVILAGPLSNLFFALLAVTSLFYFAGVKQLSTVIGEVRQGMPAAEAGIKPGDKIINIAGQNIKNWDDLAETISKQPADKTLSIKVDREGKILDFILPTEIMELENVYKEKENRRVIGIIASAKYTQTEKVSFVGAVKKGVEYTYNFTELLLGTVKRLVTGKMKSDAVGGPLTIAEQSGKAAAYGIYPLVLFLVNLSINLFILNLLPIPVLDGGHLMYCLIEIISFGKGLHEKIKMYANMAGGAVLALLMVFVFYKDIERIFFKPKPEAVGSKEQVESVVKKK